MLPAAAHSSRKSGTDLGLVMESGGSNWEVAMLFGDKVREDSVFGSCGIANVERAVGIGRKMLSIGLGDGGGRESDIRGEKDRSS